MKKSFKQILAGRGIYPITSTSSYKKYIGTNYNPGQWYIYTSLEYERFCTHYKLVTDDQIVIVENKNH